MKPILLFWEGYPSDVRACVETDFPQLKGCWVRSDIPHLATFLAGQVKKYGWNKGEGIEFITLKGPCIVHSDEAVLLRSSFTGMDLELFFRVYKEALAS